MNLDKAQELYYSNNLLNKVDLCEARLILIKAKFYFKSQEHDVEKIKECLSDLIKASTIFELNNCS